MIDLLQMLNFFVRETLVEIARLLFLTFVSLLASGEHHFQKKQTDTVGQDDEELMISLGLIEGGSRAGQGSQSKQVAIQDQATSPIVIEDESIMIITLPIYKIIRKLKPMLSKEMIALETDHLNSHQEDPLQGIRVRRIDFKNSCENYLRSD
jgi:hypothetical protein